MFLFIAQFSTFPPSLYLILHLLPPKNPYLHHYLPPLLTCRHNHWSKVPPPSLPCPFVLILIIDLFTCSKTYIYLIHFCKQLSSIVPQHPPSSKWINFASNFINPLRVYQLSCHMYEFIAFSPLFECRDQLFMYMSISFSR